MGKKQHYLPRLLLRNFSCDDLHKQINIFLLKNNQIVNGSSLYAQAYKDNLYGSDQFLENILQKIESQFGSIMNKLTSGNSSLSDEEKQWIKIFVIIQRNRTPVAEKDMTAQYNLAAKEYLKEMAEFRKGEKIEKHIDSFKVGLTHPYHELIKMSVDVVPYIDDLRIKLLESNNDYTFILGEHPVLLLNPYLYSRKWPLSIQSIGLKGTLIIMPISPKYCLMLYDNVVYGFHKPGQTITLCNDDILKINYCQFLQTDCCIYFAKGVDTNLFQEMATNSCEYRNTTKPTLVSFEEYAGKSNTSNEHFHRFVATEKINHHGKIKNKNRKKYSKLLKFGSHNLPVEQTFEFIVFKQQAILDEFHSFGDAIRMLPRFLKNLEEEKKRGRHHAAT